MTARLLPMKSLPVVMVVTSSAVRPGSHLDCLCLFPVLWIRIQNVGCVFWALVPDRIGILIFSNVESGSRLWFLKSLDPYPQFRITRYVKSIINLYHKIIFAESLVILLIVESFVNFKIYHVCHGCQMTRVFFYKSAFMVAARQNVRKKTNCCNKKVLEPFCRTGLLHFWEPLVLTPAAVLTVLRIWILDCNFLGPWTFS